MLLLVCTCTVAVIFEVRIGGIIKNLEKRRGKDINDVRTIKNADCSSKQRNLNVLHGTRSLTYAKY